MLVSLLHMHVALGCHDLENALTIDPFQILRGRPDTRAAAHGFVSCISGFRLYVANSDSADPHWRVFDVLKSGQLVDRGVFADAKPLRDADLSHSDGTRRIGNPDGLKVDSKVRRTSKLHTPSEN